MAPGLNGLRAGRSCQTPHKVWARSFGKSCDIAIGEKSQPRGITRAIRGARALDRQPGLDQPAGGLKPTGTPGLYRPVMIRPTSSFTVGMNPLE